MRFNWRLQVITMLLALTHAYSASAQEQSLDARPLDVAATRAMSVHPSTKAKNSTGLDLRSDQRKAASSDEKSPLEDPSGFGWGGLYGGVSGGGASSSGKP